MKAKDRIIVALDVADVRKALSLVEELSPHVGAFKIGLEFITSTVASLINPPREEDAIVELKLIRALFQQLRERGFWDGKFCDIPNTVGRATEVVAGMNFAMLNVHASAGPESVEAAVHNRGSSQVLGVTVLTSINENECISIFGDKPGTKVLQFSRKLFKAGADGIICSPQELKLLRQHIELDSLLKITPGVRPTWAATGDQKRIMTPGDAILAGADYLVIGRPITQPPNEIGSPAEAAQKIAEEIEEAMGHIQQELC
jgi:orotidine-5'-phosphate decarboxylase